MYQHKNKLIGSFTKKYSVDKPVHYEMKNDVRSAIRREKQLKKWNRKWELELIEKENPEWKDISEEWFDE